VSRVLTGVEVLAADGYAALRGERIGLLGNPTSVLPDLTHDLDRLAAAGPVRVVAAFGPEHGFRGSAQDGESETDRADPATGVPTWDLYRKSSDQMAEAFRESGVDTVVFDIQDVGARFYTYIWTMYLAMRGAAAAGVRFVVLDRPNPTGGDRVSGPVLDPEHASFIGLKPIALQHGMTAGELAGLFNAEFLPGDGGAVDLRVVPMRGWRRGMPFEETGLPWVPPSPNMPTVDTAVCYPGQGLFEGTLLSEGRGTTRPFETVGAPWIDRRYAAALNDRELPGIRFREAWFTPMFGKFAGELCGGVQLHVTDRASYDPVRTALEMIVAARDAYPDHFGWRPDRGVDRLAGTAAVRTMIDAGARPADVLATGKEDLDAFEAVRERHLRY
jgi:uncharacterized protein YbbC (DUF1343 family)